MKYSTQQLEIRSNRTVWSATTIFYCCSSSSCICIRRKAVVPVVVFCIFISCLLLLPQTIYADEYDDYVQQVLKENENDHYGSNDYYYDDSEINYEHEEMIQNQRRKVEEDEEEVIRQEQEVQQQQQQAAAAAAAAEKEREKLLKIQREREDAFEADLARIVEKDQRNAIMKQKKIDAKVVNHVLHAAKREDHYGVLRLWWNNIDIRIPKTVFNIPFVFTSKQKNITITIPGIHILYISTNDIKKAYREMAKITHPDKNRDGRADEAFVAVEKSASFLLNEQYRTDYDNTIRSRRIQLLQQIVTKLIHTCIQTTQSITKSISIVQNVLGPFAFPVSIVGVLLL